MTTMLDSRRRVPPLHAGRAFAGVVIALMTAASVHAADAVSVPAPTFHVDDSWVFDRSHETGKGGFSQQRVLEKIERIGPDTMLLGIKLEGSPGDFEDHMTGLDLSQRRIVDGESKISERLFVFPLKIGDTWEDDFVDPHHSGVQTSAHVTRKYKVIGWEDVVVPAGTFHALKIEAYGKLAANVFIPATAVSAASASPSSGTSMSHTQAAKSGVVTHTTYRLLYYVPQIKFFVKSINEQYDEQSVRTERSTDVLVSYKPGA